MRDERIFSMDIMVTPDTFDQASIDLRHTAEQQAREAVERRLAAEGLDWPVVVRWRCEAFALQPDDVTP